jgi:hypothetical protein
MGSGRVFPKRTPLLRILDQPLRACVLVSK